MSKHARARAHPLIQNQIKSETALSASGFYNPKSKCGASELTSVHPKKIGSINGTKLYYKNKNGKVRSFHFHRLIDFNLYTKDDGNEAKGKTSTLQAMLDDITLLQHLHCIFKIHSNHVLHRYDLSKNNMTRLQALTSAVSHLKCATLLLNEGTIKIGWHHDAKSPVDTLLVGLTNYQLDMQTNSFLKKQNCGDLIVDGLVPL